MRVKKVFLTIIVFFIMIIILSNEVLALTDVQMRAADLNWDGVVDQQDLKLLVDIGYPDRPEDGVESLNGNYLDLRDVGSQSSSYSGTSIGLAFTQMHENGAMWLYCNGNEESCKSNTIKNYLHDYRSSYYIYNYIDEAKEVYYPRGDGTSNGSLNYGYGVYVYNVNTGYVLHADRFREYGINIRNVAMNRQNLSVEIVDNVSRDIWLDKREEVISTIEELGYSESDFESYQIDCLADFRYQGFYASPVIRAYMQNGKQCNSAVRASSGGFSYGSRGDDRWTLFSQGIYQWSGSGTVYYVLDPNDFVGAGSFLEAADQVHREEMSWTYSQSQLYWNDIERSINNPMKATCCATYVSCVIYRAGYATTEQMNSFNYNYVPSLYSFLRSHGWEQINSYDDMQPGDVVFMNNLGHVQIYAGDDTWYNAGNTSAIQRVSPYTDTSARNRFNYALRPQPIR